MNNDSRLRAIESQIKENRRLLLRILYLVDEAPGAINDGHRITADGVSFIPGTGRLDDIDRERSPEVLAAIARDEAERT